MGSCAVGVGAVVLGLVWNLLLLILAGFCAFGVARFPGGCLKLGSGHEGCIDSDFFGEMGVRGSDAGAGEGV